MPRLVDTHAHVFTHDLPMTPDARYRPAEDAPVEAYLAVLDAQGFDRGVLVQPSFLGTDNSHLLAAIAHAPDRLRGVVVLDDPGSADLEGLHAGGVRGIRLNLLGRPLPDLGSPAWRRVGTRLAALGWHLEVQASEPQWHELAADIARWPGRVVVDHLGLPEHEGDTVLELAGLQHVWVKLSAPYRSSLELAGARARALVDAGRVDRMLFGSDWPFTQHEDQRFGSLVSWGRELAGDGLFDDVLPRNAALLFDFPPS